MEVVITVTDAVDSATSVAFARQLSTLFNYRKIESETLVATQPQAIQDLSSSEASNTEYIKNLTEASKNADFHIDIRTFSEGDSPTVSVDFIIASVNGITDPELDEAVKESLEIFSDTKLASVPYSKMYISAYISIVLRIPTISILVNEESVSLYQSAAGEIAQVVENFVLSL